MAKAFEVLTPYFVGWDTSPAAGQAVTVTWPTDFPARFQNSEKGLLIQGVTLAVTVANTGVARRAFVSLQGPSPSFVEWARIPATATLALNGARRVEFQAGLQTGTTNLLFKESFPEGLVLLPGHRLVLDLEDRQAGDVLTLAALRGKIV